MMAKRKGKKGMLFLVVLFVFIMMCGCGDKGEKKQEPEQSASSSDKTTNPTSLNPTALPGIPPYYVMLDGTLMQIKEEVEGDFSEYQVGTVTYTGDLFKLPEEDGQSNYSEYDGCVYALKDGAWYMYCCTYWIDGSWCKLGPDE